jgi:hypothetical protein
MKITCQISGRPCYAASVRDQTHAVLQPPAYGHPPVYGPMPIFGLPVQVQCEDFKCMAYLDKNGQWMDFFTRTHLSRVLGVVPLHGIAQ